MSYHLGNSTTQAQNQQRHLDSRGRTTTSMRFDLSFFTYCQKIDTPEFIIVLFFTRKVSTVIVIDLVTVFDAVLTSRQTRAKLQ